MVVDGLVKRLIRTRVQLLSHIERGQCPSYPTEGTRVRLLGDLIDSEILKPLQRELDRQNRKEALRSSTRCRKLEVAF